MCEAIATCGSKNSWSHTFAKERLPSRPTKVGIFAVNAEAINASGAEIDFDLGAGVSATHFYYEPALDSNYKGIPHACHVLEVDFSPSMEGVPNGGAVWQLEAIQTMAAMVMKYTANNMRNVDHEGNIVLPIVRYTTEGFPMRDYVVLPAPEYILFRTHRAMSFRVKEIMNGLQEIGAIGDITIEKFSSTECPSLAAAILKYAQSADARVTENLTSKVYIIAAPIIPFDVKRDSSLITEVSQLLPTQLVFAIGQPSHGK